MDEKVQIREQNVQAEGEYCGHKSTLWSVVQLDFSIVTTLLIFGYTHTCVSTVYSVLSKSCEKISQAYTSGGIRTHDPCNSRAVSYQLDYRGCPAARGSSNPLFENIA